MKPNKKGKKTLFYNIKNKICPRCGCRGTYIYTRNEGGCRFCAYPYGYIDAYSGEKYEDWHKQFTSKAIDKVFQKGYREGYAEGYGRGVIEWEEKMRRMRTNKTTTKETYKWHKAGWDDCKRVIREKIEKRYKSYVTEKWGGDPYNLASNFYKKEIWEFMNDILKELDEWKQKAQNE